MASPAAILRAAKAVPGGARPTSAPQGSNTGPYFGRISPLAEQLANENSYANAYSPFLPRPSRTFTEGAFSPFSPILPVPVDAPPPGADLPDPRRFDYETGWNLPSIPGQDGYRLASFQVLDTISRLHSITRTCIERRKAEVAGLDWDIVPTKEASKAYQGDRDAMRDFGKRRAEAIKFFRQPDPDPGLPDFGAFISALLEQLFVYDATSILLRPKRGRGLGKGILGSDLDSVELIDGATIRPLLSLTGGRPRPPAPGYQQYLKGVPRSDLQSMWNDSDIEQAGLKGYEGPVFSADQLMYRPIVPRINSPYGFSCVEMALLVIMTGLRKQAYQLQYYDEGTIPGCFISPGDPNITPTQIRELQDALEALAGDQAWHHKIIVLPPGAKVMPQRAQDLADQFDEFLANEIAMVFDVDPMSLGIIPKVSTVASPFAAREMAQASRTVHERTSTKPLLKFLCSIFNTILHRVCGQDDMRWTFAGMDEAQDQAAMTDLLVKQVQNGFISIDEAREELQRTAWGLDETSGPLVFTQMGPVPLNQMIDMMRQMQPMQPGQNAPANSGNGIDTRPAGVHHPPSSRPVGSHNPRLGLPSGAGMRTGLPSGGSSAPAVSDTPAHSAARGHQGAAKAVRSELDALARHLRKGRDIATWIPRHLTGATMAVISEDLTKGIGVDEVIRGAVSVALPREAYEWADEAAEKASRQWPGWQKDRRLQQLYAQQIRVAFSSVTAKAVALVRQWLSGALAVTFAGLIALIAKLVAQALKPVLEALWREAWHMGRRSAVAALRQEDPDWQGWEPGSPVQAQDDRNLDAWLASHGAEWLERIPETGLEDLEAALAETVHGGDPEAVAEHVAEILQAQERSGGIAATELGRAQAAGADAAYREAGVALKEWLTEPGSCTVCLANEAEGPVPFDAPFQSGVLTVPQHPHCRCSVIPSFPEETGKLARGRSVELSGQEYWPAGSYPHGPAMGGGAPQHAAHDATGTQRYVPGGVPDMTAGGEPPRAVLAGDPVVQDYEPGTGRTGGSRGGGTVGGPYRDRSDETHVSEPLDADDAAWPGHRGVPPRPGRDWPAPYMDGYWPPGGQGTAQAPGMSVGAMDRGRPPNAVGKGAADFTDANPVEAEHVYLQLARNFPADAISWVRRARWTGPQWIPWDRVDTDDEDKWAASRQPGKVDEFARQITEHHGHVAPSVLVQEPGTNRAFIVDGHHRALARRKLGQKVLAYVGSIDPKDRQAAIETHGRQVHSGSDPANKAARDKPPIAAGLAVRAADTGRILMLQRAYDEDDPAGGRWEFPGGRLEDGEDAFDAARREWGEETGCEVPDGELSGLWNAGNGKYRGFVLTVPSEGAVDILGPRDDVENPDGDFVEALAWWEPKLLRDNPAVREELAGDLKRVRRALKSAGLEKSARGRTSAEILREYWTHEGHPGPTQYALEQKIRWGEPDDFYRCTSELTPYIGAEAAKGYCNLRHHEVLGYWPAQHARMEHEGK